MTNKIVGRTEVVAVKNPEAVAGCLFVRDEPRPADLALVFGHCDAGVSNRRVRRAASFYHQGLVPRILFSGGGAATLDGSPEAEAMAQTARDLGVPEEALLLEKEARNTFENLKYSYQLLCSTGLLPGTHALLLVSCPWHMRRVLLLAQHVFPRQFDLFCCPHDECCTEQNWEHSAACRQFIQAELDLVARLTASAVALARDGSQAGE